jgi:hypothetical protein
MSKARSKRHDWVEHDRRWQASGLSQHAYCEREGLALSTFGYWRRRAHLKQTAASKSKRLTFVPAQVSMPERHEIEVRGPGGWRVSLPGTFEVERLAALMRALA